MMQDTRDFRKWSYARQLSHAIELSKQLETLLNMLKLDARNFPPHEIRTLGHCSTDVSATFQHLLRIESAMNRREGR